jgi:23S rRNA pseudouridine2605 synthase
VKTLERTLSRLGIGSRTQAEGWILAGRVTVDGRVCRDPARWVDADRQALGLDGRPLTRAEPLTLRLFKPKGLLTSFGDPQGRPTVYDLLGDCPAWVFPVGRLDQDTSGLLLLTNQTDLAEAITNPASELWKRYRVRTRAPLEDRDLERLRQGVLLDDGPTRPARAEWVHRYRGYSVIDLSISEGRNRQVRRMLRALDNGVRELRRMAIGPLELGEQRSGTWRPVSAAELVDLRRALGRGAP